MELVNFFRVITIVLVSLGDFSRGDQIRQYPGVLPEPEVFYYFEHLTQVLRSMNYSVTIPKRNPADPKTDPLVVTSQLYIESIRDIQSDCIIDLYMRETWEDPRLKDWHSNSTEFAKMYPKLVNDQTKILWKPDSYFFKIREETVHLTQFLWAHTNGTMLSSRMFTVVIPCHLDVLLYPFDTVVCKMSISSYTYITEEIMYRWKKEDGIIFPTRNLDDLTMNFLSIEHNESFVGYEMGNFSTLFVHIKFGRNMSSFFVQVFAPAALIVMLSWLGFYINRNSTPARASIGVTTVLTMLTLASQTNYSRNEVIIQSTTACDIYIWFCFTFVIAAMIEFAFADYFNKPRFRPASNIPPTPQTSPKPSSEHVRFQTPFRRGSHSLFLPPEEPSRPNSPNKSTDNSEGNCEFVRQRRVNGTETAEESAARRRELWSRVATYVTVDTRGTATNVDVVSRVLFPIAFFIFNTTYWLVIVLLFRRVE
ncbi:gamma-aminobutyric acid receptor subunit pi-like [Symsagittifera roscoffensis]|uniref:gamma-aminobutyric acid receptor subunit pi-like n=1 Tax=Symsagittifera roscoffensis TaxID=84072 RepID=UPI00307CAFCA